MIIVELGGGLSVIVASYPIILVYEIVIFDTYVPKPLLIVYLCVYCDLINPRNPSFVLYTSSLSEYRSPRYL